MWYTSIYVRKKTRIDLINNTHEWHPSHLKANAVVLIKKYQMFAAPLNFKFHFIVKQVFGRV